jgi:SAM-dependent methyltransferase
MDMPTQLNCPLCRAYDIAHFHRDNRRDYYRCETCQLVFVPPDQRLSLQQEKAIYDLHQNNLHDEGYRRFLSRLYLPLAGRIKAGSQGLDYGCGPGPALAAMFIEHGFPMALFDPIYANQPEVLQPDYDFISCTEVVEHFATPECEFQRLFSLLVPGGWLGIMTKLVLDKQAFSNWHYKNDQTHICFFSKNTFQWLARQYQCRLELLGGDVILLQKHF